MSYSKCILRLLQKKTEPVYIPNRITVPNTLSYEDRIKVPNCTFIIINIVSESTVQQRVWQLKHLGTKLMVYFVVSFLHQN